MILQGFQTIISRQTELTKEAAVISAGLIRGGVRNNIIPEELNSLVPSELWIPRCKKLFMKK